MKKRLIGIFVILTIIMLPLNIFASDYTGIDTDIKIEEDDEAVKSSIDITNNIVGTLQVVGTIVSIASLTIIGLRYMFSSVQERAQMKGVIIYWIIGAVLVFGTSNVLAIVYDVLDNIQHEYQDAEILVHPTCVSKGIMLQKCIDCGRERKVDIPIDPDAHSMSAWVYTLETCETDGKKVRTCMLHGCEYREEELVPRLGHDFVFGVIKAPTCTENGYQGNKCRRASCGLEKDKTVLVATGHSAVYSETVEVTPTCYAVGRKKFTCQNGCGDSYTETLSKIPHNYTKEEIAPGYLKTPVNCTQPAVYYKKCTMCPAKGTNTFTYGSSWGHDFSDKTDTSNANIASSGTCLVQTKYYCKCTKCGQRGTDTFSSGYGDHAYGEWTEVTAATCTSANSAKRVCSICNSIKTGSTQGALGHNYGDWTITKAATCGVAGTRSSTCSRCSDTKTETISALAHTYGTGVVVEPTCTTFGYTQYTCTTCSATESTDVVWFLGHDWEYSFTIGVYSWYKCSRCGEKTDSWRMLNIFRVILNIIEENILLIILTEYFYIF